MQAKWLNVIIIVSIIFILIFLIYELQKKSHILFEFDGGKKKVNGYGISFIVITMLIILSLFIPITSNAINNFFFPESVPVETPLFTPPITTKTLTAQISSTSTDPSNPTETPTPLPSETTTTDIPTITKTPENTEIPTLSTPIEEFADSCIPSDWKIYPGYLVTLDEIDINQECLNLNRLGFTGLEHGLNISAKTDKDNKNETAGIYHLLSIKDNFELNIKFKDLDLLSQNSDGSIIYIMFINSKDALKFTKISDFDSLFMFTNNNLYFNNKEHTYSYDYYIFHPDIEYLLTCDKNGQILKCNIKGLEKEPIFPEIQFNSDWDSIFIGYYLSADSSVKVNLTHFRFIPIEP